MNAAKRAARLERLKSYRDGQFKRLGLEPDALMCRCGHTGSGHLIRLEDGAVFNCCTDDCGCPKFEEAMPGEC